MIVLLAIEFLDEFVFGIREAGWPLIRDDLDLSYAQIGILLSLPRLLGSVVEPPIGILGDVWKRRWLILSGGVVFVAALVLISVSQSFLYLLVAFILFYPASGAFVNLSQATLMDSETDRHEQNMARWGFAGSLGVVLGAAVLGGAVLLGVGWRVLFLSSGVATVFVLVVTRGMPLGGDSGIGQSGAMAKDLKQGIFDALRTLKFFGAALVGVIGIFGPDAGRPPRISGPLLCGCGWHRAGERRDGGSSVDGSRFGGGRFADTAVGASTRSDLPEVQRSSGVALVSGISVGAGIVAQAGDRRRVGLRQCGLVFGVEREVVLIHAGSERGRDGRGRRVGLVRGLIPLGIGIAACTWGLGAAMWLLLAGPVALLVGIPRQRKLAS